jgi:hypothetical protein
LEFWLTLFVLYSVAVFNGAPDFPFRVVFPVLTFFETYSCYRCAQDNTAMLEKAKQAVAHPVEATTDALENG